MALTDNQPIGFLPTQNPAAAREFYEKTLGLRFDSEDDFAIVFRVGSSPGTMLRVFRMPAFTPPQYTAFGWEVANLEETVDELSARGIEFLRYDYFEQDERGIWHTPDGSGVAWFQDPDGNTLSLSRHSRWKA